MLQDISFYSVLILLEDRGAQAPLILAPAEGFRGPSAPFGGLRPLLWGLWPLLEAYGLSQYHQWISQLEYMLFDTQHVEIGPKMAEIAKIAWKLHEIAWTPAWNFLKVLPMNFSARVHAFWYPTCWNWPKNGWNSPNCVKIAWNCVKLREHTCEIFRNLKYSMPLPIRF